MIVKCKLYFRKCVKRSYNGNDYYQVRFLDENDNNILINLPCIKENDKYLSMHKDTLCDIDLLLYSPSDKSKARFCLMGV